MAPPIGGGSWSDHTNLKKGPDLSNKGSYIPFSPVSPGEKK